MPFPKQSERTDTLNNVVSKPVGRFRIVHRGTGNELICGFLIFHARKVKTAWKRIVQRRIRTYSQKAVRLPAEKRSLDRRALSRRHGTRVARIFVCPPIPV